MSEIDHYAVFGHPVKHSKSPRIHQLFAMQTGQALDYIAQDVTPEVFKAVSDAFFVHGGKGLNCTVPLKELAWQYADRLTERARMAKAVNTLKKDHDGGISGDNTDGIGLVRDLTINHQIRLTDSRILILGAGGASRGILGSLLECGPKQLVIANRTLSKAEIIVEEFSPLGAITSSSYPELAGQQFDLVINATSASLSAELPPLPDNLLTEYGSCYDLAYSTQSTPFVKWGHKNHAVQSLDGIGMLVEQAAEAFFIWRGIRPQTAGVTEYLNAERHANTPAHC
jgi:shikimate dehydrogenase